MLPPPRKGNSYSTTNVGVSSRAYGFATAPFHGQGLLVISEDMASPSAEAALVHVRDSVPAPIAVGAGHPPIPKSVSCAMRFAAISQ